MDDAALLLSSSLVSVGLVILLVAVVRDLLPTGTAGRVIIVGGVLTFVGFGLSMVGLLLDGRYVPAVALGVNLLLLITIGLVVGRRIHQAP